MRCASQFVEDSFDFLLRTLHGRPEDQPNPVGGVNELFA